MNRPAVRSDGGLIYMNPLCEDGTLSHRGLTIAIGKCTAITVSRQEKNKEQPIISLSNQP